LYEETEESSIKREQLAEARKLEHQQHASRERRPDKRQRRRIINFKNKFE
jgi:ribosome-associated heat shock protein Hsp15